MYNKNIIKEISIMTKQHDKQFKLDAVQYYLEHKKLGGADMRKISESGTVY